MPDGLDQSYGRIPAASAAAAGIKVISGYLSYDLSKNWSPDWISRYHAAGIGCLLNWEALSGAPLNGASQGESDATEAVRQARALFAAVGSPGSPVAVYFSCDRDITVQTQGAALLAYYKVAQAICHAAGMLCGAYGEADVIDFLHREGVIDVGWQTLAWSGGRVSSYADFYQQSINNTLAGTSVDFDVIEHAAHLGAWWPSGSQGESAANAGAIPIGDLPLSASEVQTILDALAKVPETTKTLVHQDLAGTLARVLADQPEIIGLRETLRGSILALAGQAPKMPDGTVITSVGAAHQVEMNKLTDVASQINLALAKLDQLAAASGNSSDLSKVVEAAVKAELSTLTLKAA